MSKDSWNEIPRDGRHGCDFTNGLSENFNQDEIVFISHSLGSRIAIDGYNAYSLFVGAPGKKIDFTHY